MTTKEYLGQVVRLNRLIGSKMEELKDYESKAFGLSAIEYDKDRIQTSPDFDKIGSTIAKLDELRMELNNIIDSYVDKKNEIVSQIESMDNYDYFVTLYSKYVENRNWTQISEELHHTYRHTIRLHADALREFERRYGNSYKFL